MIKVGKKSQSNKYLGMEGVLRYSVHVASNTMVFEREIMISKQTLNSEMQNWQTVSFLK